MHIRSPFRQPAPSTRTFSHTVSKLDLRPRQNTALAASLLAAWLAAGVLLLPLSTMPFANSTAYAAESTAARAESGLPARSEQQIAQQWSKLAPAWTSSGEPFATNPKSSAPYAAGSLNDPYIEGGVARANLYRYIAGFPADLVASPQYNQLAQHGAVLNAAIGKLDHTPGKPASMDQSFYDTGYKGTSSSNLASLTANLSGSNVLATTIDMYMDDSDASNIDRLGHRRWVLSPSLAQTGFGLAEGKMSGGRYDGYYSAMHVFDDSRSDLANYRYTAFPAVGAMPTELFKSGFAWSVLLNMSAFEKPDPAKITVTLTDVTGGAKWSFSAGRDTNVEADKFFNVDTDGYGYSYAVIFRPDGLRAYAPGDRYSVRVDGLRLTDGSPAYVEYTTSFFSVEQTSATPEPTSTPWPDTAGHWANEAIAWAKHAGLVDGYPDGTFRPDARLSEAEFLAMFLRSFHRAQLAEQGEPAPGSEWSAPLYNLAGDLDYPLPGLAKPEAIGEPILRQTVAEVVARADGQKLRGSAAVQYLLDEGYSQGKTSATVEGYEPMSPLTRAEAVQFIRNLRKAWIPDGA